MTRSPAFQFYPKDWLSSAKMAVMTCEEEGAYIRLLAFCWDSGDCSLPDDDAVLAAMTKLGERWLNGCSTHVRSCFVPHPRKAGFLTNERLLRELEKQESRSHKCSEAGKASGESRNNKVKTPESKKTNERSTNVERTLNETRTKSNSPYSSFQTPSEEESAAQTASAVVSPPPKSKKPRKEPTGPHHDAIRAFTTRWSAKYGGEKFPFAAKDATAIAAMLASLDGSIERFERAVDRYLAEGGAFYAGHGTGKMQAELAKWLTPLPIMNGHANGESRGGFKSRGEAEAEYSARMARDAFAHLDPTKGNPE